ncbi:MAG: type II toxin-antitoxin system PemK/MazF family toxin [Desulfovermiculus sp.]|nr:type II toxin-antitoxin system PemK/MazF family toxin [Desulfovermiculus sp.]
MASTLKFGELPGNILLQKNEANMPQRSVVNMTQMKTVDKASLKEIIGSLSRSRMLEVYEGLKLVMDIL